MPKKVPKNLGGIHSPLLRSTQPKYGSGTSGQPTAVRRRYVSSPRYFSNESARLPGESPGMKNFFDHRQPRGRICDGPNLNQTIPENEPDTHSSNEEPKKTTKLGTMAGVTLPTILNVLSILMFVRFGFVLGQMGILGTLLLLTMSYGIDLLTTLSVSAIATNGIVKGGGAYYMISRSLGVEFGGAIGIILYIGQILNSALNVAGLIEPLLYNFGLYDGVMSQFFPNGQYWQLLYATIILAFCTVIAFIGAGAMSRGGPLFCLVLLLATLSVPISVLVMKPFSIPSLGTLYSGLSWETLKANLWPHYTIGAAGSQISTMETFNDVFGIFFPATAGILAGSAMSEDLENPSKSIPRGTLQGLLVTVICYLLVICAMGSAIPRNLLYRDVQVIQTVSAVPILIILGEMATALFSVIVGLVGAAQLLQAMARDEIFPGLSIFIDDPRKNRQHTKNTHHYHTNPGSPRHHRRRRRSKNQMAAMGSSNGKHYGRGWYATAISWLLCQLCLFADINQIATLITMTFLMTFIAINVACGLLKIGSAPNFRPSFRYFNVETAFAGTIASVAAMFIVDGVSALLMITFLAFLIVLIHYVSPPKQWGDVSQSLIYHQVRKYLLKLKQDNVKYWRPQILLLVDNPRTTWRLISFCNNLKKGGLYVLGHVMVTRSFQHRVGELNKQRGAWEKIRDLSHIKAFVQISIAPSFVWGVRNVFLGCGLGGMKPNITMLAFYDLSHYSREQLKLPSGLRFENDMNQYSQQVDIHLDRLPTDECTSEQKVKLTEWVQTLEDFSLLNSNLAVAKGFPRLNIPSSNAPSVSEENKQVIDLYPIQMASKVMNNNGDKNILTTNFDTYTLILQLGAILHTVPAWYRTHRLRVVVFVEYYDDIEEEKKRIKSLLEILRIEAEVVVKCLDSGELMTYNYIARGEHITDQDLIKGIDEAMEGNEWWASLKEIRADERQTSTTISSLPKTSGTTSVSINPKAVRKFEHSRRKRFTFANLNKLGVSLSMVANKIPASDIHRMTEDPTDDEMSYSRSTSDSESVMSFASSVSAFPSPFILPNASVNAPSLEYMPQMSISSQGSVASSGTGTNNDGNGSLRGQSRKYGTNNRIIRRQPILDSLKSGHTIRKERSTMMFSAETIPTSHILDNAQGNEPSIVFVKDKKPKKRRGRKKGKPHKSDSTNNQEEEKLNEDKEDIEEEEPKDKERAEPVNASERNVDQENLAEEPVPYSPDIDQEEDNDNLEEPRKTKSETDKKNVIDSSNRASRVSSYSSSNSTSTSSSSGSTSASESTSLSFNELPNRCQFIILHELMSKTSAEATLLFSTLPVPDIGLHNNEEDCLEYASNLELWCNGLPPILLINAKTITVTTNL